MGFEPTTTGITIQDSTAELQPPLTGAPDRIRTCYPRLRRPVLYPDELRAHSESNRRTRGSGWRDLNPRHLAPKASALPGCATPRTYRIVRGPSLRRRFGRRGRRRLIALRRRRIEEGLSRKAHAALVVSLQHLHLHDLAFLQVIRNRVHALVGDLRDMQQAVLAGQQLHDRAEVEEAQHRAFVDPADFDFRRDRADALLGRLARFRGKAGDGDGAVVLDVDGGTGLAGERLDDAAALADHLADLVGVDLHLDDARCVVRHLDARPGDRLFHD